jgi:poly [ADP-ribose] polymerase
VKVQNVYTVRRPGEFEGFASNIDNQRLLFHGSRVQNWVGLLSRGILLPKLAVSLGARRTDAGWLGHGIYFGDSATTSAAYTSPGRKKTSFMAVARVALGRVKDFTKITYGLTAPPEGYDSCHGVPGGQSQFYDHEFVIYQPGQQRMEYLVEFSY